MIGEALMKFKDKISAHNRGEYDLARELINLAQSDMVNIKMELYEYVNESNGYTNKYRRWRPVYSVKKDLLEYRVAKRIREIIAIHGKKAKGLKATVNRQSNVDRAEFDGDDFIYTTLSIVGLSQYHIDDLLKLTKKELDMIESSFGDDYDSWDDFLCLYSEYKSILVPVEKEMKKLHEEIIPLIEESLNEILPKVDLNRTDDQIIGFISIATKRLTHNKLTKFLGNKVHRINGQKYYVNKSQLKLKQSNLDKVLGINPSKLTNNQYNFYMDLKKEVQKVVASKNGEPFTFNPEGDMIGINKRYFAQSMDMEESTFKKRLKRLQDKSKI